MHALSRQWLLLLTLPLLACEPGASAVELGPRTEASETPRAKTPTIEWSDDPVIQPTEGPWRWPALQTEVAEWSLEIPAEALGKFEADPYAPEEPATFIANGVRYPVAVRYRGASARSFPKKSWNVNFFKEKRFHGRDELNLVAEYQDSTMMAEKIAYDLLEAMGVPAPRTQYVRVLINGVYQGVFLDIEEVDKEFVQMHRFDDSDADIWRCGWKDCEFKNWRVPYQGEWKKKTNEATGDAAVHTLMAQLNEAPEPEFPAVLEEKMELEHLLSAMATDALVSNNFIEDSESYLVLDKVTGRFTYVPWDLNNADARFWYTYGTSMEPVSDHPLFTFTLMDDWVGQRYEQRKGLYEGYLPVFSNLFTRIGMNPELRERFFEKLERAMEELFNEETLHPRIDAIHALLTPHMKDDPYIDLEKFEVGRPFMKKFVTERVPFLRSELSRYRNAKPTLVIEAFDPSAGWVEVRNRGSSTIALGGKALTGNLREAMNANLPAKSLTAGQRLRMNAGELGMTFGSSGELGLFDGQSVVGMIDLLFYGQLPAGKRYERDEDGTWRIR